MSSIVELQVPLNGDSSALQPPEVPPWSTPVLEGLSEMEEFTPVTLNGMGESCPVEKSRPPDRVHHASFAEQIAIVDNGFGSSSSSTDEEEGTKDGREGRRFLTAHGSENEIPIRRQRSRDRAGAHQVSAVLKESGIDVAQLSKAFSALDVQGDGGLELFEFRRMWKEIFPQRPLDQDSWKTTEKMFTEIDFDASGVITFEEIIAYLEQNRQVELRQKNGPTTLRQWIWVFVGTRSDPPNITELHLRILVYLWKVIGQVLMMISVVCLMIESMPDSQPDEPRFYHSDASSSTTRMLQIVCNIFFTVEFVGFCIGHPGKVVNVTDQNDDHDSDSEDGLAGTMKTIQIVTTLNEEGTQKVVNFVFLTRWVFWLELTALIGFYIELFSSKDVIELRSIAVFRVFRITQAIRALRHTGAIRTRNIPELGAALRKSLVSLLFLSLLLLICILISATLIFYAETRDAKFIDGSWYRLNETKYGSSAGSRIHFQSIPESLWWGIVTITTVGYGDMYPDTFWGRMIASCTMFAGVVVVSFPITILQSTFQQMEEDRLVREMQLENCKEFYNAIKSWLESGARVRKDPKFSNSPPTSRRVTALGATTGEGLVGSEQVSTLCTNIETMLKQSIGQLEANISNRFNKLETRLSHLEDVVSKQQAPSSNASLPTVSGNQKRFFINLDDSNNL